jgi:hypothetical protein
VTEPGPHWHSADQIMRSPLGRQALREGGGRELFHLALQHGTPTNFTQDDRLQFAFAEGVNRQFRGVRSRPRGRAGGPGR